MKTVKFKINKRLGVYKEGEIICAKVDRHGVPMSAFLRRMLEASKEDDCIERVKNLDKPKPKKGL